MRNVELSHERKEQSHQTGGNERDRENQGSCCEQIARPRGKRTEIRNEMSANAECADGDMTKQAEEYLNSAECNEQIRPAADKTRGDSPSERQTEQEGDQDDAETLGRAQPQYHGQHPRPQHFVSQRGETRCAEDQQRQLHQPVRQCWRILLLRVIALA